MSLEIWWGLSPADIEEMKRTYWVQDWIPWVIFEAKDWTRTDFDAVLANVWKIQWARIN